MQFSSIGTINSKKQEAGNSAELSGGVNGGICAQKKPATLGMRCNDAKYDSRDENSVGSQLSTG